MIRIIPSVSVPAALLSAGIFLTGCFDTESVTTPDPPVPIDTSAAFDTVTVIPKVPRGFPGVPFPGDNPLTAAKVELGRRLFFDARLSRDQSVSCATCHRPEGSFSDPGKPFTFGIDGHATGRNSPSLANIAYTRLLFADGRSPSLEHQALAPILSPLEMDMDTLVLAARLASVELYRALFRKAWGDETVTMTRLTASIASFERLLLSGGSPYDRFMAGDGMAISEGAKRGEKLFFGGKAVCFRCHSGFNFTDQDFHNTGLDFFNSDPGRFEVTGLPFDDGKFKTPSLRNIGLTPPYMHDGRFNTLREVLDHYDKGGLATETRDPLMGALGLDESEIGDLILFLESLTDSAFAADPRFRDPWIR